MSAPLKTEKVSDSHPTTEQSSDTRSEDQTPEINYPWTDKDEDSLRELGRDADARKDLHETEYSHFNRIYVRLTLVIIIIGIITGFSNVGQNQIAQIELRNAISIVIAVVIGCQTTIQAILHTFEIPKKMEQHFAYIKQWELLLNDIRYELALNRVERSLKRNYMKKTKNIYDRFVKDAPHISTKVTNMLRKRFIKEHPNVILPSCLDTMTEININRDAPLTQIITIGDKIIISDQVIPEVPIGIEIARKFKMINGRSPTDIELQDMLRLKGKNINISDSQNINNADNANKPNKESKVNKYDEDDESNDSANLALFEKK
jgi:hypothetical protein